MGCSKWQQVCAAESVFQQSHLGCLSKSQGLIFLRLSTDGGLGTGAVALSRFIKQQARLCSCPEVFLSQYQCRQQGKLISDMNLDFQEILGLWVGLAALTGAEAIGKTRSTGESTKVGVQFGLQV